MKRVSLILTVVSTLLVLVFQSCETEQLEQQQSILPQSFKVDIPDALSQPETYSKSTSVEPLNGNDIYGHLANFISVGEGAADIVQGIIFTIAVYDIDRVKTLTFTSEEDGRDKNMVVTENVSFDGESWQYMLNLTDADSEGNEDGGKAIQIFWDTNPIKGIAVLKPYNIDRNDSLLGDAMVRIDYTEDHVYGYDKSMMVYISNLTLEDPLDNPYSISALKMFVGKIGNDVDVYGNSDHPNAKFFTAESGFNWAFVASGDDIKDIGVAEVGLPPSGLNETSRTELLETYSIRDVFTEQIYETWPGIDPQSVETYLENTEAPGFFDTYGFIQGGMAPSAEYDELVDRIEDLTPYNPLDIEQLQIGFKE